jgi:hypothetical protein
MRARFTPQYRAGRKPKTREAAELQPIVGTLEIGSDRGKAVLRRWRAAGESGPLAELWTPTLVAVYGETFRITGIERAPNGTWVHQAWYCEVGGAWRHEERRATERAGAAAPT